MNEPHENLLRVDFSLPRVMQNLRRKLPPISSLIPFEAAARHKSITAAARELGLTQAAVSKQVKTLEDHIGLPLFERRNRAVYLTEQGHEFGRLVTTSLSNIADAAQKLQLSGSSGEIVLRSQLCEGLYWLMPRLSGFYESHPNIPVRVSVSTQPISQTTERFDIALQSTGRDFGSATHVFSASDDVFPVCSPKYLKDFGRSLSLHDIAKINLLHHQTHPQDWIDWNTWLRHHEIACPPDDSGAKYDSYPMMMQAALEGHGIALGWFRTVARYLETKDLVRPFGDDVFIADSLSVYVPNASERNPNVSALLDWLKTELL